MASFCEAIKHTSVALTSYFEVIIYHERFTHLHASQANGRRLFTCLQTHLWFLTVHSLDGHCDLLQLDPLLDVVVQVIAEVLSTIIASKVRTTIRTTSNFIFIVDSLKSEIWYWFSYTLKRVEWLFRLEKLKRYSVLLPYNVFY